MPRSLLSPHVWAVDTETSGLEWQHACRPHRLGCVSGSGSTIWTGFSEFDQFTYSTSCRRLRGSFSGSCPGRAGVRIFPLVQKDASAIVGHNLKFDAHMLARYGLKMDWDKVEDTIVMAGLVADDFPKNLLGLSMTWLDYDGDEDRELLDWIKTDPRGSKSDYSRIPDEKLKPYTERQLVNCLLLRKAWLPRINKDFKALFQIERRLQRTLFNMEERGIQINHAAIHRCRKHCETEIGKRLQAMRRTTHDKGFEPNKPTYLLPVLEKLGLDLPRTPTGKPDTSVGALTPYVSYPFIQHLLAWRKVSKILSTYVNGIEEKVCTDGMLRCTFNQTGPRTGRLSSSGPNLQNIPARDPVMAPLVKAIFMSRPGYETFSLDYKGQELVVGFTQAEDPVALEILKSGGDLHDEMMRVLFPRVVKHTGAHRTLAKAMNFGIFYGARVRRISRMLADARAGILTGDIDYTLKPSMARVTRQDKRDARSMLDMWFGRFRRTRDWISETTWQCERQLWVEDLHGRRYRLPYEHAYKAVNSLVQGMSATITKSALADLDDCWAGTDRHILLQVHDEIVIELPKGDKAGLKEAVDVMESQSRDLLALPLKVDVARWSPTWGHLRELT